MMHPALFQALQDVASHLGGHPVRLELRNPFSPKAKGCMFADRDFTPVIRVRLSLWETNREAFWRVYLHGVAHLREHVYKIKPSDGRITKPVRGDDIRGKFLAISDGVDELTADLWADRWRKYAGRGPIVARLLRLMSWQGER